MKEQQKKKEYKKRIKRVYKESDRASPCNGFLRELQVIDTTDSGSDRTGIFAFGGEELI